MMRKKFLLAVALVSVLAISGTAVAHVVRHDTRVTARYDQINSYFLGQVISRSDACESGRALQVIELSDGQPDDPDEVVATGTTDEDGFYQIDDPDRDNQHDFVVRATREVLKKSKKHTHVCKADRSRTFSNMPLG